jgi:hypothetical protein
VCQSIFALCHLLLAVWFSYDVFFKEGDPSSASAAVSPSATASGDADASTIALVVWAFTAIMFAYGGVFWALINAIGLAGRRRWARVSTMAYAVVAITTCIGVPYAAYTLWSLSRDTSKRTLDR